MIDDRFTARYGSYRSPGLSILEQPCQMENDVKGPTCSTCLQHLGQPLALSQRVRRIYQSPMLPGLVRAFVVQRELAFYFEQCCAIGLLRLTRFQELPRQRGVVVTTGSAASAAPPRSRVAHAPRLHASRPQSCGPGDMQSFGISLCLSERHMCTRSLLASLRHWQALICPRADHLKSVIMSHASVFFISRSRIVCRLCVHVCLTP